MTGSSNARGRLLSLLTAEPIGPRTPPYPTNHGQLDDEDEERRLDHRADDRWNVFRLEVDGVPQRQPSAVAALTRESVPDRERDGHELSGRKRGARRGAKRPFEDDRPFALVVARDPSELPRSVGREVRASLAGELKGLGAGQIEEPEIDRVLAVAEDEVGLAGAGRHLRGNLDRDCVRELGWLVGWRRGLFGKGVFCSLATCWRLPRRGRNNFLPAEDATLRAAGALGPGCGGRRLLFLLRRHGKRRPALACLLRTHV